MKCAACGHTEFKDAFLSNERGILYLVKGKPSLKNQLMGKRKKITTKICKKCGHCMNFASLK